MRGDAPVAQVPDHLCACRARGFEHRQKAGPVIHAGGGFNQVPAQAVADGAHAGLLQQQVVRGGVCVVVRRVHHINLCTICATVRGAFKAAHKKTFKNRHR